MLCPRPESHALAVYKCAMEYRTKKDLRGGFSFLFFFLFFFPTQDCSRKNLSWGFDLMNSMVALCCFRITSIGVSDLRKYRKSITDSMPEKDRPTTSSNRRSTSAIIEKMSTRHSAKSFPAGRGSRRREGPIRRQTNIRCVSVLMSASPFSRSSFRAVSRTSRNWARASRVEWCKVACISASSRLGRLEQNVCSVFYFPNVNKVHNSKLEE